MLQKDFFSIWVNEAKSAMDAKKADIIIDLWLCIGIRGCEGETMSLLKIKYKEEKMTWEEFKKNVDKKLLELGKTGSIDISYMDFYFPSPNSGLLSNELEVVVDDEQIEDKHKLIIYN